MYVPCRKCSPGGSRLRGGAVSLDVSAAKVSLVKLQMQLADVQRCSDCDILVLCEHFRLQVLCLNITTPHVVPPAFIIKHRVKHFWKIPSVPPTFDSCLHHLPETAVPANDVDVVSFAFP
jgi:hypothetical protein